MDSGKTGMGSKKHGKSGFKNGMGKSPKARYMERIEAEKNEIKPKKSSLKQISVMDLIEGK